MKRRILRTLYSPAMAARRVGVTRAAIRTAIDSGLLPVYQIRRTDTHGRAGVPAIAIDGQDLDEWTREKKHEN